MNSDFFAAMSETLNEDYNYSRTENGALGYKTSGKNLLDLNFAVSSLRKASERDIISRFEKAFFEDKLAAMKWLFFARDVRGGLGERRLFRTVIKYMAVSHPDYIKPLLSLIAEYGRWDDVFSLFGTPLEMNALELVSNQLLQDIENMQAGKPISLLAKWLPSIKATSRETIAKAKKIIKHIHCLESDYRKAVGRMRSYLKVVEKQMSQNQWNEINYSAVPSRANLIYNNAFLRHDEQRRREFLSAAVRGEAKINSSVLYPHEIIARYRDGSSYYGSIKYDEGLEALWSALPDTVGDRGNTLVVCDGSGSMFTRISSSGNATALDVSHALAIYFAERITGGFKNKFITFSSTPQLVDLSSGKNLYEKLRITRSHTDCSNTNIEKVFELILRTAVNSGMSQADMPANVLIISDMEFDPYSHNANERLFDAISKKYAAAGYKLPRLVFWNVCSRTGTVPIRQNELGLALVSGFSPNIADMVMSGQLDPYLCLLETLNKPRYQPIEEALMPVLAA